MTPQRTDESLHSLLKATASSLSADEIAADLIRRHREPHRHYHTLEHIESMLRQAEAHDPVPALLLAIWYHDAVYDPRSGTNEADSADLFRKHFRDHISPELHIEVRDLILATDHRTTPSHDPTVHLLLDLDLSILAAPPEAYDRYAQQIRQEYIHVEEDIYRSGRKHVLQSFLDRKPLYRTEAYRQKESTARANLERELAGLA